ncbi:uncharacterized protein GGS22DRAFT_189241 [Annulohypoxylon maeteangense]|uniref:uncharacterized protein n=1 Tax=Annulohypoxylon maeteangense TaxID=1927788 RepID=UPI002007CBC0|nr:uncharacterized protein GGS22DRAFT_189241 [Annulohypoxylon maeteangense]KAI0884111.1 hypothetical protein GGS22DRAFT_189241 [Annulohypoxylon maeteangense]
MAPKSAENTLLLFGPQLARLVPSRLIELRRTVLEDPNLEFLIEIIKGLPSLWADIIQPAVPRLGSHTNAKDKLRQIATFFENEDEEAPRLAPPYNLLLAPLTVISQIAEYIHHGHQGTVQGFCIGFLSAAAVASARNKDELEKLTATAIRLAVVIGGIVDFDEQERSDGHTTLEHSSTWSVRWTSALEKEHLEKTLASFTEAYVSCITDVDRVTITISESHFIGFSRQLADGGLSAQPIGLCGRYHTTKPDRGELVQQAKTLCQQNQQFQFPAAEQLISPLRSTSDTEVITSGVLHEIALNCILVDVCKWYDTVQAALDAWDGQSVNVIPIGNSSGAIPRSLKSVTTVVDDFLTPSSRTSTPPFTTMPNSNLTTGQTTPCSLAPPPVTATTQPIAVIGMACRYAQADSLEEFWSLINSGKNATTPVPENRFKSSELWRTPKGPFFGNFIKDHDAFDHRFFGMSAREAASMDPQQRLLLQVSYEAMESAGYPDGAESPNRPIGCYVGAGYVEYEDNIASEHANAFSACGAIRAFISGRVSHYFGWTGPSVVFDTACSSSAVAIHNACKALQTNDCSIAIAAGVNVITSPTFYQNLAAASFLSPTGCSKAFDATGNGYCRGEGAGVLVLKPLAQAIADNDRILGTIAGTAVNQNSSCSPITVPDSNSQSDLYLQALAGGGISPSEVSYVEAHGTGTPVGDPIECASIRTAFGDPHRAQELVIGSVKDVIGHTEASSGVAGVIKTLLMLQHGSIPKQPNFTRLNPKIPALEPDRLAIADRARQWQTTTKRAALINNYGAAGSNAAIVVQEYRSSSTEQDVISKLPESSNIEYPILLSAKTPESLRAYSAALKSFLDRNDSITLGDVAYNLARKQNKTLEYTSTWTTTSLSAFKADLDAITSGARTLSQRKVDKKKTSAVQWPAPIVLCFGGQTGRSIYLSRDLFNSSSLLRAHLENCDEASRSLGLPSFFPRIFDPAPVDDLVLLHAMLFSVQYASAKTWIDAGLQVSALIGHSFGQLTALAVSGSLDLTDGLRLVTGRAQLMQKLWGADPGVMLAIEGDKDRLDTILQTVAEANTLDVACYNGPRNIVLAGEAAAVDSFEQTCKASPGLKTVKLANSHAYHSRLADPILDGLEDLAGSLVWRKPSIPVETCSRSQSWTSIDPAKIAEHTRETVYFAKAVQRIANRYPSSVWLEAGSMSPITGMVRRAVPANREDVFLSMDLGRGNPWTSLSKASTGLWAAGSTVDFWAFHGTDGDRYKWLDLPPYQFAKTKHWIQYQPHRPQSLIETPAPVTAGPPELLQRLGDADGETIFAVDPSHEIFELSVKGHAVVGQSLTPAGLYFELAIRAAQALQDAGEKSSKVPHIENMRILSPLGLKPNGVLRISFKRGANNESGSPKWSFTFFSTPADVVNPPPTSKRTNHAQGTVTLLAADAATSRFQFVKRLLGRSRYDQIASNPGANRLAGDVLYKIFARVVNYAPYYKGVRNTVAYDGEVVGDVVMPSGKEAERLGDSISDPLAIDNFLQIAGIHVNCLLEGSDDEVSVCNAIGEVLWSDAFLQSNSQDKPSARTWRLYSNMEPKGKNTLVNDVFVLDAATGAVVVALLGAEFTTVPLASLRRVLSKINENSATPAPSKASSSPLATNGVFTNGNSTPAAKALPNGTSQNHAVVEPSPPVEPAPAAASSSAASAVDLSVRTMLSEIFGMSVDEVQLDSDLADLGVDSLMITEISGEIQKRFDVTLSIDDMQDLTDVQSLTKLLGGGASAPAPVPSTAPAQNESTTVNGTTNGHKEEEPEVEDGGVAAVSSDWLSSNRSSFDVDIQKYGFGQFRQNVYPLQSELVIAYTVEALASIGCDLRTLNSGDRLPEPVYEHKHNKLIAQMYQILEDGGLIAGSGASATRTGLSVPQASATDLHDAIVQKFPQHAGEHKLLRTTGARLADCLKGQADPLALMFGNAEARQLTEDVYTNGPMFRAATSYLARFLVDVCERFQGKREIRILELGAGTGGTTKHLIEQLNNSAAGQKIRYTFSDVSKSLVAAAKRKFAKYPFMEYGIVDIEKEPAADVQGRFDVIISTNCIHATPSLVRSCTNIGKMLRKDGQVCLVEHTQNLYWFDLVWGLVEGWWLFDDGRKHALASELRWKKDLETSGFQWVDWSDGASEEAKILRVIVASPTSQLSSPPINTPTLEIASPLETEETVVFKQVGSLPLQADIFYPSTSQTGSKARPIALMVHGGGHIMLSRKDVRPKQTQTLLDAGFLPISVDYRLCPETTLLEGPITDVRDALNWARSTLPSLSLKRPDVRITGEHVVAVGWSTGGTLALSLGWTAPSAGLQPPDAILAFYCPTDYEDACWSRENKPYGDAALTAEAYNIWEGVSDSPIVAYNPPTGTRAAGGWMAKNDARSRIVLHMNWHGQTVPVLVQGLKKSTAATETGVPKLPAPTTEQVQAISPLAQIRAGAYKTPTFLVHPYEDDLIPWQQAQRTADELRRGGVDVELRLIGNAAHLFDMYRSHEANVEAVRAVGDGLLISPATSSRIANIAVEFNIDIFNMKGNSLAIAAALAAPTQAYLRFGCATLSVQRLDPLVEPGVVPSAHLHQIIGGNGFNATMDPTEDVSQRATCTTCTFSEDLSNYWTAVMYFKARNGTYKRVGQYPNALLGDIKGGMTVYYIQESFNSNGNQKMTAFKPGFRMTVGTPNSKDGTNPGLRYTCLQDVMTRFPETAEFPKQACPAGIMAIHHFPACWDGKNLDSPNHQDHMYNTNKGGFVPAGACPASHPVRVPQVALETMWDTRPFNDKSIWPEDGSQPFVWSYEDSVGYGTHADYVFGWKGDALQRAMDSKSLLSNGITTQSVAQSNQCTLKSTVVEDIDGWLTKLPGRQMDM